jgi:hypothetical protein
MTIHKSGNMTDNVTYDAADYISHFDEVFQEEKRSVRVIGKWSDYVMEGSTRHPWTKPLPKMLKTQFLRMKNMARAFLSLYFVNTYMYHQNLTCNSNKIITNAHNFWFFRRWSQSYAYTDSMCTCRSIVPPKELFFFVRRPFSKFPFYFVNLCKILFFSSIFGNIGSGVKCFFTPRPSYFFVEWNICSPPVSGQPDAVHAKGSAIVYMHTIFAYDCDTWNNVRTILYP